MALVTVFLSSTGKDLGPHRAAAHAALHALGDFHCIWMEDFAADDRPPRTLCEESVRKADLFVGVLGHCHGARPPGEARSYTEIEYGAAVEAGLPRLMFVAPDDFPVPAHAFHSETDEDRARQRAFRDRVLKQPTETSQPKFTTPDELAARIKDAVHQWAMRNRQAAARARPFTVPAPVGDFTGREAELAALETALTREGRAAISAVRGLGGVGKSQLAYAACARLAGRFPDGLVHLDMQGTAAEPLAPAEAMARIVEALEPGARPPADPARARDAYLSALHNRRVLLLLDNARDLGQVRELAPPPPCAMLVTSRARIVLPGAGRIDLDGLPEAEALALLREILGEERPTGAAELEALAERCARLPLALRAAGTFLLAHPSWPVADYLAALGAERLRHLGEVGAVLRLSVEALEREEPALAAMWRQLAVFPAGFRPEAAAAVWRVEIGAAREALDGLHGRSLVQAEPMMGRFRLHDLVRDLAATGLDDAAREEAAARHSRHYCAVLAEADDLFLAGGDGVLAGLALFDQERPNVEAGQRWAASRSGERDAATALPYAYTDAGAYVLDLRLPARERIAWLEAAVADCRRLGDRHGEGNALGNLGVAWAGLGDIRRAIEHYEQRLAIAREIGDRRGEGNALGNLGNAWADLGETRHAIDHHEQYLAIAREIGDRRGEGNALGNLGVAWKNLGETRRAIDHHEQDLAIRRQLGDRRGEGVALGNLGNAWADLGETRRAIEYYKQVLATAREISDRHSEGNALRNLGDVLLKVGDRREAVESVTAALAIYQQIESPAAQRAEAWLAAHGSDAQPMRRVGSSGGWLNDASRGLSSFARRAAQRLFATRRPR